MSDAPVDYRPMWTDLGLDLEAHDMLLTAIPQLYTEAYLTQQDRPEGMAYFDFVMSEIHGLRIKELQDHKAAGGTVVGTFCLYVPGGDHPRARRRRPSACAPAPSGPTTRSSSYLPRNTCALIKSASSASSWARSARTSSRRTSSSARPPATARRRRTSCSARWRRVYVMELPQMKRPQRPRAVARGDRPAGREAGGGHRQHADRRERCAGATKEVNDKRRALQRLNAARAASPGADLRPGRAARRAGRLLRRRAALHADGERDRRRARGARRRGRRRRRPRTRRACSSPARRWPSRTGRSTTSSRRPAPSSSPRRCAPARRYYDKLVAEDRDDAWTACSTTSPPSTSTSTAPASRPTTARIDDVLRLAKEYEGRRHRALRAAVLRAVPDRGVRRWSRRPRRPASRCCASTPTTRWRTSGSSRRASRRSSRCSSRRTCVWRRVQVSGSTSDRAPSTRCG